MNAGAGTLSLIGSNTGADGAVYTGAGASITTSGTVSMTGTATGASGRGFQADGSTINVAGGSLSIDGTSTLDAGVQFRGVNSISNVGGSLSISGHTTSYRGMELFANAQVAIAGNATLAGAATTGTGLFLGGNTSLSVSSGNVSATGSSTSNVGTRFAQASVTNSGAGVLSITGTSSSNQGVLFTNANTLTKSGAGSLTIGGTSSTGAGLRIATNSDLNASGSMTLTGTSSSVQGIHLQGGNDLAISSGSFSMAGISTTSAGFQLQGNNSITNLGGTLSFSGVSGSYRGIELFAATQLAVSGDAAFVAASASGPGLFLGASSTASISSGNVSFAGTSPSFRGVEVSNASLTNSGAGTLTLTGTSTTSAGVYFSSSNTLTRSGAGGYAINGVSDSGTGLHVVNNAAVTTSGSMTLSGVSTSGDGVALAAPSSITQNAGALTISGASQSAAGIQADATSTLTNNTANTLTLTGNGGMNLGATISSLNGPLRIDGSGTIAQTAGTIAANELLLSGVAADFDFNVPGNQITELAANAASVALTDDTSLTIGTVLGVSGVTTSGALTLITDGDLTIAAGEHVSGASPVLAATAAFINNQGNDALTAASGRWLIYSSTPGADTFGALDSGNTAIWDAVYASLPPASVTAIGNRYLFALTPTLTFTSTDGAKTYGADFTAALASQYIVSGYQSGVADAFLGDSAATAFSGAPSVSSPGAAASADVSGSPYAITVAQGSLASSSGYDFSFASPGLLTVTPKTINYSVGSAVAPFGTIPAGGVVTLIGIVPGDDVEATVVAFEGATPVTLGSTTLPGTYILRVTGLSGTDAGNYALALLGNADGVLTIVNLPATDWPDIAVSGLNAARRRWCDLDLTSAVLAGIKQPAGAGLETRGTLQCLRSSDL
jgi:hypothetical protein